MAVTSDSLEFFHDIIYFANIESITNQSYVLQYPVFKVIFKKVSRVRSNHCMCDVCVSVCICVCLCVCAYLCVSYLET